MAEVKKQLKNKKRGTTPNSKGEQKPRRKLAAKAKDMPSKNSPVAVAEQQAESSITVDPNADGEEALRNSVNHEIATHASEIAKALAERAVKGNGTCDKFLLDLMSRKKKPVKSRSKSMSRFIDILKSEPEWVKPETTDAKKT